MPPLNRAAFLDGEHAGVVTWGVDEKMRSVSVTVRTPAWSRTDVATGVWSFALAVLTTADGALLAQVCNGRLQVDRGDSFSISPGQVRGVGARVCWATGPGRVCVFAGPDGLYSHAVDDGVTTRLFSPEGGEVPVAIDARFVRGGIEFEAVYEKYRVHGRTGPGGVDPQVVPARGRGGLGVGIGGACLLDVGGFAVIRTPAGGSFDVGGVDQTWYDGRWVENDGRVWDLRRPDDAPFAATGDPAFGSCDDGSVFVRDGGQTRWLTLSSHRMARNLCAWGRGCGERLAAAALLVLVLAVMAQWLLRVTYSGQI